MSWRETDHPRWPAGTGQGGRFRGRSGWAGALARAMSRPGGGGHYVRGRDARNEFDPDVLAGKAADPGQAGGLGWVAGKRTWGDPALDEIARVQGFDGPPEVIDRAEMDRRVSAGWIETWRGVGAFTDSDTGRTYTDAEAAERFRSGEYRSGMGIFGNGYYTTPDGETARNYVGFQGSYEDPPGLLRLAIHPDARVIDFDELAKQFEHYWQRWQQRRGPLGGGDSEALVWGDAGRFAAALGYDVIAAQPRNPKMRDGRIYSYVVLNRTAVAVQEASS